MKRIAFFLMLALVSLVSASAMTMVEFMAKYKAVEGISDVTAMAGSSLKEEGIIPTGGAAKWFLKEHDVRINDELEDRRGRKLYPEDVVIIPEHEPIMIKSK